MATPSLKKGTSNSDLLNRTVTTNSNPVRAFYELPEGASTSAQIVKESRDWLRSVSTCRPFTPKDKTRSLLNTLQTRTGYRPPSAFKVTAKSFDPYETTSKSNIQLEPIHIKVGSSPLLLFSKVQKNLFSQINHFLADSRISFTQKSILLC